MKIGSHNWIFARPLWRGFAIAPPITALVYMAIQILLTVLGVVEYKGSPDEEEYIREPVIIAINFVLLSIACAVNMILCGLPLIYILKRFRRLTTLMLILGGAILGAVVLPIEIATVAVISKGVVLNWIGLLAWLAAIGAVAGGFTACVFGMVVGIKARVGWDASGSTSKG